MRILRLNLKAEYFDDIRNGAKLYEYRLVTPYWQKRLAGKTFDMIIFAKGYPKSDDAERHCTRPYRGYELQTITHPHFGPSPVQVFAIRANDGLEVIGERCIDDGKCHHQCIDRCFRRAACGPLSGYSGPWAYPDAARKGGA